MSTDAKNPANYRTVTRNGKPCLVCGDCGREGAPGASAVRHARNCDLVGAANKLVGPLTATQAVAEINRAAAAVNRGDAALTTSDKDVELMVRAGIVSMSAAMNQDL